MKQHSNSNTSNYKHTAMIDSGIEALSVQAKLQLLDSFKEVRDSGLFNMITQASQAAQAAGLTMDEYKYVVTHFSELEQLQNEHG